MSTSAWQLAESLMGEAEPPAMGGGQSPSPGDPTERAIDAVVAVDHDLVGDSDKAKRFILALIDQAGFSTQEQKRFAQMLRVTAPSATTPPSGENP